MQTKTILKYVNLKLIWNMYIKDMQMKSIIKYINQIDFECNSNSKSNMQG